MLWHIKLYKQCGIIFTFLEIPQRECRTIWIHHRKRSNWGSGGWVKIEPLLNTNQCMRFIVFFSVFIEDWYTQRWGDERYILWGIHLQSTYPVVTMYLNWKCSFVDHLLVQICWGDMLTVYPIWKMLSTKVYVRCILCHSCTILLCIRSICEDIYMLSVQLYYLCYSATCITARHIANLSYAVTKIHHWKQAKPD